MIVERDLVVSRRKNDCAGDEVFFGCGWEFFLRRRAFRDCDVTRRADEFLELFVRHRGRIHPESVDAHTMNRFRVV